MIFYPHYIGAFDKATRHLTRIERSIYRDLIDMYYDTEKPLMLDIPKLCRLILARSNEEVTAVEQVLNEFFIETPDGWRNFRCDEEIDKYYANASQKALAGKASAAARAEKRQRTLEQKVNGCSTAVQQPFNGESTNKNQNKNYESEINKSSAIELQEELAQEPEKNRAASPIPAEAEFAIELRSLGVNVQSHNPTLLAWIADGITIQKLTEAAAIARLKKPLPELIPANFLDRIVREPPRQQSPPTQYQTAAGRRAAEFDRAAAEFLGNEKPTGTDLKLIEGSML